MSELNGKSVKSALMHEDTFYPGVGNVRKELHSVDDGINRAVKMTILEPFLQLEMKDKGSKPIKIAVPLTNFKHLILAD